MAEVKELIGKTLKSIVVSNDVDEIVFTSDDGKQWLMHHVSNCCESVNIEDVVGDILDLVGSPILVADEVTHENENPEGTTKNEYQDDFTWTFYKFSTIKGSVTIRWYGESNGYYSERVDFDEIKGGNRG